MRYDAHHTETDLTVVVNVLELSDPCSGPWPAGIALSGGVPLAKGLRERRLYSRRGWLGLRGEDDETSSISESLHMGYMQHMA